MFEFIEEYRKWIREFLDEIGSDANDFLICILVIIEIISETTSFARLRSLIIFGTSFVTFTAIAILIGRSPYQHPNAGLTVHQFCEKNGFDLYNETVRTQDGYILTIHRIKCPQNKKVCKQGPPILFLHGLFGSSADYMAAKNESLAFQLANQGYDVWLGNNRGNTYSRKHIILEPDDGNIFWDFSFHEIGFYDLPAMIDYVLRNTNFDKLTYVGMSQACPAFLVMNSLKPEYSKKIILANFLAPVTAYPVKSLLYKAWSFFHYFIRWFFYLRSHFEFFGSTRLETMALQYLCVGPHKIGNHVCYEYILNYIIGLSDQKDYDVLPFFMSVSPAGASTKQLEHLMQNMMLSKFAYFDYYENNLQVYHQNETPDYNITNIQTPLAIYFGKADILVNVEGIYCQYKSLPNVVLYYKIPCDDFNHMDFIYAKNLNKHLNGKIIETINVYNKRK